MKHNVSFSISPSTKPNRSIATLSACAPILVKCKETNELSVVIRSEDRVIFFDQTGEIMHTDWNFFKNKYETFPHGGFKLAFDVEPAV